MIRILSLCAGLLLLMGCVSTMPVAQAPSDQSQLTREVQTMLALKGFDPGPADGVAGRKTYAALAQFQRSRGLPTTNGITQEAYHQLATDGGGSRTASASQTPGSRQQQDRASGGIDDPRAATNDGKVLFRAKCPGLFIPRVFESKYQGLIPGYAMYVVNKSEKRYTVKYDMVYTRRGDGILLRGRKGRFSSEKDFTIRPNTMVEFWLAKKVESPYTIESIDGIEVFECDGR
jgi:peptidoglycan hydrolase-like protein with peptidoglycan-binding domain